MTDTFSEASPEISIILDMMHGYMVDALANDLEGEAMRQFYVLIQGLLAMQADLMWMSAEQAQAYCEALLADHLLNIGVGVDGTEKH